MRYALNNVSEITFTLDTQLRDFSNFGWRKDYKFLNIDAHFLKLWINCCNLSAFEIIGSGNKLTLHFIFNNLLVRSIKTFLINDDDTSYPNSICHFFSVSLPLLFNRFRSFSESKFALLTPPCSIFSIVFLSKIYFNDRNVSFFSLLGEKITVDSLAGD